MIPVTQVRCACNRLLFEVRVPIRECQISNSHFIMRCPRCKRLFAFRLTEET